MRFSIHPRLTFHHPLNSIRNAAEGDVRSTSRKLAVVSGPLPRNVHHETVHQLSQFAMDQHAAGHRRTHKPLVCLVQHTTQRPIFKIRCLRDQTARAQSTAPTRRRLQRKLNASRAPHNLLSPYARGSAWRAQVTMADDDSAPDCRASSRPRDQRQTARSSAWAGITPITVSGIGAMITSGTR